MQEIKKRRILLASVLKPVDDTRMYEKMAITLAAAYDVYVVGQPSKEHPVNGKVNCISLPAMKRLSWRRLLAPWRVLSAAFRIRPHLLIVCTAELVPIALCARLVLGIPVVYDVQENHALNIKHGTAWPRMVRSLLAASVRCTERCAAWAIRHYLLAEKSYAAELPFIGRKFTIIENKVLRTQPLPDRQLYTSDSGKRRTLLFTGTLADTTGVFDAIDLTTRLHERDAGIQGLIIGYAAKHGTQERLRELVKDRPFIRLEGVDHLVPHQRILQAIDHANFGIICYPQNVSTWNSFPTKLYEYMGRHLPILLINNPKWVEYCAPYNAAVVLDTALPDIASTLTKMNTGHPFYAQDPIQVYWDAEAPKLLHAISSILPVELQAS